MRFVPPPQANVVKREDKTERLIGFISEHIASAAEANRPLPIEMCLIARSAESPVARALAALKDDLARAGVEASVVFAQPDADGGYGIWTRVEGERSFIGMVWLARNPRLVDVHEVLTIGTHACWIGDSMRRDPEKRDAFETFVADCPQTTRSMRVSFGRIAALSDRVRDASGDQPAEVMSVETALAELTAHAEGVAEFLAGTRH